MDDMDTVEIVIGHGLSIKIEGAMATSHHTDASCNSLAFRGERSATTKIMFQYTEEVAEDEWVTHVEQAVILKKEYGIDNSKLFYDLIAAINNQDKITGLDADSVIFDEAKEITDE